MRLPAVPNITRAGQCTGAARRPIPAAAAHPLRAGAIAALALAAFACLPGCATGRVNLWPVYFHEARRIQTPTGPQTVNTTEALYPVFHRESDGETTWHAVRPLYNAESDADGRRQVQYLWPLGLILKGPYAERHHRLFPLFGYHKTWSRTAKDYSMHAHVLQLVRWGRDARFGPYLAFIPLAGVTHNVIGPTWSFVLFPLYSHYRHGDYVRDDFPWPVAGYGRTPDGLKVMRRFWPFYVAKREQGARGTYVWHAALWPMFRWGRLDRGGELHHTVFVAAPFYSSVKTWDRQDNLVAHTKSILGFGTARDSRGEQGTTGWSALFSLLKKSRAPKTDTLRIFPFYWQTTHYGDRAGDPGRTWVRRRVLWPFVWVDSDRLHPGTYKKGLVIAPFYWQYAEQYDATEDRGPREGRRVTLWPLATWQRDPDGARHFWVVSHGWRDPGKGYKRNYRAILDLFQYHRDAWGEVETRVLSRLYHHRRGPNGRYLSLMSLFTYDSTAEVVGVDGSYVSALFGLIKCSWADGEKRWRILYVPL